MKYALIVMAVVYLVTFGCNPKTEKENTTSQNKSEHEAFTEAPTAPAELTFTTQEAVQTTPEAGPVNHNPAADQAPAAPANVVVTTEKLSTEAKPAAEETVTILPCGKKVSQNDAKYSPCAKHSKQIVQQTAVTTEETELGEAMQKMVNATNDMVTVTRHLVMATQQMVSTSKDVAVKVIDTGKDAIENSKPAVQNTVDEKEIIETVKEAVSATREAFKAASEALSDAIKAQEDQPVPEATPQQ